MSCCPSAPGWGNIRGSPGWLQAVNPAPLPIKVYLLNLGAFHTKQKPGSYIKASLLSLPSELWKYKFKADKLVRLLTKIWGQLTLTMPLCYCTPGTNFWEVAQIPLRNRKTIYLLYLFRANLLLRVKLGMQRCWLWLAVIKELVWFSNEQHVLLSQILENSE